MLDELRPPHGDHDAGEHEGDEEEQQHGVVDDPGDLAERLVEFNLDYA